MPLHRVNPVFVVEQMVERRMLVGVRNRMVHIVVEVVVGNGPVENPVGVLGKHNGWLRIVGFELLISAESPIFVFKV